MNLPAFLDWTTDDLPPAEYTAAYRVSLWHLDQRRQQVGSGERQCHPIGG